MRRPLSMIAIVIFCCASAQSDATRAQHPHPPAPGGWVPPQRPVARACPGGTATDVVHVYSECNADGYWHVVTDRVFICPNGKSDHVRIADQATAQRCDDQPIDPNAPPRIRQVTAQDFPQERYDDPGTPTGATRTFRECRDGVWFEVTYDEYRARDGRIMLGTRPRMKSTGERCDQPPPARPGTIQVPGTPLRGAGDLRFGTPGPDRRTSQNAPSISTPVFTLDPVNAARARQNALGPLVNLVAYASAINAVRMDTAMLSAEQKITASEPSDSILSEIDEAIVIADGRIRPPAGRFGAAVNALLDLIQGPRLYARQPASPVEFLFTSLGGSTGEILEMQVFKTGTGPVRLQGLNVVLEPLKKDASNAIRRELQKRSATAARTLRLNGYCLEFLKAPPSAGTVFRIAPAAVQQQFAPVRNVLDAARRLHKAGQLNPDSDPSSYFNSIRQWAIWSGEQRLDQDGFRRRFIEHTRKNVVEAGRPWTSQLEALVVKTVPNRWNDIGKVLRAARSAAPGGPDAR